MAETKNGTPLATSKEASKEPANELALKGSAFMISGRSISS